MEKDPKTILKHEIIKNLLNQDKEAFNASAHDYIVAKAKEVLSTLPQELAKEEQE